jgi:hypothetical protein
MAKTQETMALSLHCWFPIFYFGCDKSGKRFYLILDVLELLLKLLNVHAAVFRLSIVHYARGGAGLRWSCEGKEKVCDAGKGMLKCLRSPPQQTMKGTIFSMEDLHWTHFFIRAPQLSQAHMCPHGMKSMDALRSEHTTHSSIWKEQQSSTRTIGQGETYLGA